MAKITLAVAILTYLVVRAHEGFSRLLEQRVVWPWLAAGLACTFVGAMLSFVRWHLLIRALELPIRLTDTLKLGSLGLALNFVSPGANGGDLFKAIFLAHGRAGRRTEAVATVVADRLMGLLAQLAVATTAILASDLLGAPSPVVRVLSQSILLGTLVCWSAFALLLLVPGLSGYRLGRWVEALPLAGRTIARLLGAVRAYRTQRQVLLAAFALSLIGALLFATSYYAVARGLPLSEPPWSEHLVIVPTAGLVGAIPITPSGLGTMELAIEELYKAMPGGVLVQQGDGTMVALAHRVTEIAVALLGLVFFMTHRREVSEVYAEAEEAAETL